LLSYLASNVLLIFAFNWAQEMPTNEFDWNIGVPPQQVEALSLINIIMVKGNEDTTWHK
jgi:hypothetical protein